MVPDQLATDRSPESINALQRKIPAAGPCDIFLVEAKFELAALRRLSKMLQAGAIAYRSAQSREAALHTLSEAASYLGQLIERLAHYASGEIDWPAPPI